MNIRYSEIFTSFQGEAGYAGMPTVWIRLFGCNLECNGFGQDNPTDPSTYELPYQKIDLTDISTVEQLPVFDKGCDSSYSWSKKYKHLVQSREVDEVADLLIAELRKLNGNDEWLHSKTNQTIQLCFTGGEPMLWQKQMLAILSSIKEKLGDYPRQITIETNATKKMTSGFELFSKMYQYDGGYLCFSMSPKLFNVSGEKDRVDDEIIFSYASKSAESWLKFVVDGSEGAWVEVEDFLSAFNEKYGYVPVWIMPAGATKESQESATIAEIADEGMRRGYMIATRNHAYVYGNQVGK